MSSGQRPRTPAHFPRMRYRAAKRQPRPTIRGLSAPGYYLDEGVLSTGKAAPWWLAAPAAWHNPFLPPVIEFRDPEQEMNRAMGIASPSMSKRPTAQQGYRPRP